MAKNDTPCMSNPCWSNGTCLNFDNNRWRCICHDGTYGINCRTRQSTPDYVNFILFTGIKRSTFTTKSK
jgi:hypothetical protein